MLAIALALAALQLPPQTGDAAERAALGALQETQDAAQRQRLKDCQQRFSVNACLEQARAEHRKLMQPLIAREQWLDDQARAERAHASAEREADRQRNFDADNARRQSPAPRAVAASAAPTQPMRPTSPAELAAKQAAKAEALQREAQDVTLRQHEAAQRAARLEAHRQEVERRNAARKQPPAASLAVPSASAVASQLAASSVR